MGINAQEGPTSDSLLHPYCGANNENIRLRMLEPFIQRVTFQGWKAQPVCLKAPIEHPACCLLFDSGSSRR